VRRVAVVVASAGAGALEAAMAASEVMAKKTAVAGSGEASAAAREQAGFAAS
jgi:hypothetical protein